MTMSSLGIDAIKSLLCPNLLNYYKSSLRVLEENSDNNNLSLKEDAFKIAGALLYSLQALHADIRKRYQPTHQYQYLIMLLHEMMEIFGSALALRLPIMFFETSAQPRMEKSVSLVRFGPVITKRSPLVIGLLTDGRSLTFGPSKVPNRTISIAVRGHRNRPPKTLPPYCHSDYFSLTLKTASIGRCESLFVKKFGRSVIDLSCITL